MDMNYYLLYTVFASFLGLLLFLSFIHSKKSIIFLYFVMCLLFFAGTPYRIFYRIQNGIKMDYIAGLRDFLVILPLLFYAFKLKVRNLLFYKLFIILIIFYIISTIFTYNQILVGIWGIRWVVIPMLFGFLFTELYFRRQKKINSYLKFLTIILLLQSSYAIYQWYNFPQFDTPVRGSYVEFGEEATEFADLPQMTGKKIRTYGFTYGITDMDHFLPQVGIIILILTVSGIYRNKLSLIAIMSFIFWLVIAKEKAAIAVTIVGVCSYILFNLLIHKKIKYLVVLLAIAISWGYFVRTVNSGNIVVKNASISRLMDLSAPFSRGTGLSRTKYWKREVVPSIKNNPLGYGIGMAHSNRVTQTMHIGWMPHNLYFQILLEVGIIGFVLFVLLICLYFLKVIKFSRYLNRENSIIVVSFASSITGVLAYGMASVPLDQSGGIVFWISVMMSYYILTKRKDK